ncbi:MAG TPA: RNA polymerase sigma factor [Usitatibacter sp.]|nr:RNA polymerase sigma factor [Usitatibacter sp.]
MNAPDPSSFAPLLRENKAILHKVAFAYCHDADDRRDLVQEMAIQLWRSFPRFDGRVKFSTWAYRVSMNVAVSWLRSEHRRPRDTVPIEDLEREIEATDQVFDEASDNMRVLRGLIDGLDGLNRALILLYLDGHSGEEIGEILGITTANVTTRVNRVKRELQAGFARLEQPLEKTA